MEANAEGALWRVMEAQSDQRGTGPMVLIGTAVGEFADITYVAVGDYDAFGPQRTPSNSYK